MGSGAGVARFTVARLGRRSCAPALPPLCLGTTRRRVQECKSTHRLNGWRTNLGGLLASCFLAPVVEYS